MAKRKSQHQGYSSRKVNTREIRQRFLIICEGEKTEPNYFRSFRVPKVVIEVQGLGMNPSKLVDKAIEQKNPEEYDQIWCVFDRDSWTETDFHNAIKNAKDADIEIAYSNESFELWYILHFEFLNTGIPRSDYLKKLDRHLGQKYAKNSDDIYDKLLEHQPNAIKNAENLLKKYQPCNPANDNPSTTVHRLVQELNKFLR
jgi:RloB-like protein